MGDEVLRNECKKRFQNDCEENLDNSEQFSLLHTDVFESLQSRLKPIDDKEMLGYTSQNTSPRDSETNKDSFMETEEFDTSRFHNFFSYQNQCHGEQSKSDMKCNYSNEENRELHKKRYQKDSMNISDVGRCIRTACDVLHGMDAENNGVFSQTIDSQYKDIFESEPKFFYSKEETLTRKDEPLYKNEENTIDERESQCENVELSNKPLGHDSSVEILKSYHSQSQIEISYFERALVCDICLEKLNSFTSLLKHNCKPSSEKLLQHGIHRENIYEMDHFLQQKRSDNKDRAFQCTVCDKFFLENDREWHMYTHNGVQSIQCDVCKKTFNNLSSLTRHMLNHHKEKPFQCNLCGKRVSVKCNLKTHIRTHTREKPFQCNLCKESFSHKTTLDNHIRTHTREKPFQCVVCDERFTQRSSLIRHMRTHHGEKPFVGQKRF
ncbi:zinc finger protein 333 [Trichonephila clavipes]|nr:zinc finger protein 333 [Trichonephila clavipes]